MTLATSHRVDDHAFEGNASNGQTLLARLNEDLSGELQAICMYLQYSAILRGSHRKELRDLFQSEVPDELRHAQFLADKIAVLGGTPTTTPRPVPIASQPEDMLENILAAEKQAIADYTARAGEAERAGEIGLKVELENLVVDETRHRDEVLQILAGWGPSGSVPEASPRPSTQVSC